MRVFLDTNVFISAFATRGLCADLFQIVVADHQLVIGEAVLAEVRRNLSRKLRMPAVLADEVESFLRAQAGVVADPPPVMLEIRDLSDRMVVAEALAGRADVLITGDDDLPSVAAGAPLPILSPRSFWEMLRKP